MATTAAPQNVPPPTKKPGFEQQEEVAYHRIRITLSSRNVKSLEKGLLLMNDVDSYVLISLRRFDQGC